VADWSDHEHRRPEPGWAEKAKAREKAEAERDAILKSVDTLTPQGAALLLKLLEDPSGDRHFRCSPEIADELRELGLATRSSCCACDRPATLGLKIDVLSPKRDPEVDTVYKVTCDRHFRALLEGVVEKWGPHEAVLAERDAARRRRERERTFRPVTAEVREWKPGDEVIHNGERWTIADVEGDRVRLVMAEDALECLECGWPQTTRGNIPGHAKGCSRV